ncbi:serine/threonine protein kinase [Aliikangiella sp. IMCC44359]|uniref:serine/threonine protein kinase n=1 Tax=Aliikangiella sp. IMCC44359 TaxID=3459125 RepID=UPI00403AF183
MNDSNNNKPLNSETKIASETTSKDNKTVIKSSKEPSHQATLGSDATQFKPSQKNTVQIKGADLSQNSKTIIKPSSKPKKQATNKADKTQFKPRQKNKTDTNKAETFSSSTAQRNEDALTRIDMAIRAQDSTKGFIDAQKAADSALADNKIVIKDRFVLESTLGAGGMGAVYRARDLRKVEANDLQPYIAVKVLNEDFKNHPDAFVSLQREAARSSMLAHPHNVIVYDFDRDGDIYFMTMELLKGKGLEVILREHKNKGLPVEQALRIIDGYCQGLIHAHNKNIVHSDLKPGNLFVDDNGGTKVLDYGIARITCEASAQGDFDAGTLGALTPAYASLEMFNGDEPHPSDDVYAAAIIAYELFSGRHPYDRESAEEAYKKKMKPQRLTHLSKQQWAALESGLALTRANRTKNLKVFLDGLTKKKKKPIFKFISAALFSVTLAIAYFFFYGPDKVSIQAEEAFQQANECFNQQNYTCALDKVEAVLVLLPEHVNGLALKEKTQKQIFEKNLILYAQSVQQCIDAQDLNCANRELLKFQNFAPTSKAYMAAKKSIEDFKVEYKRALTFAEAKACFNQQDYTCAREKANMLLYVNKNDADAKKLIEVIDEKIIEIKAAEDELNSQYAEAINKTRQCQKSKNYQCVIDYATKALKLKVGEVEAQDLIQQAKVDLLQQQTNLKNAANMVSIGEKCLKEFKYRCAIASAESALASIPNYPAATKLKQKARKAQRDVIKQDWKLN